MTGLHWICWFCWGAGHIHKFPTPWVLNVFPCVYVFSFIKVLHFSVHVSSSSLVVYSKVSYSFWYYCNFHFLLNFFFERCLGGVSRSNFRSQQFSVYLFLFFFLISVCHVHLIGDHLKMLWVFFLIFSTMASCVSNKCFQSIAF